MDKATTEKYFSLLEQMVDMGNRMNNFDRDEYIRIITDIAILFRLAKGVTEFYMNPTYEKMGKGEIMCDYDNGKGEVIVYHKRYTTPTSAVIKATFYMEKGEKQLSEEEYDKVDIVVRAMLSMISRNRLIRIVEKLGFYDENGYPNMRFFIRYLEQQNAQGKLPGNIAVCFNLKHFALINQEIGRDLGDLVMKNYYDMLTEAIGDGGVVCRLGGDNFTALFRNEAADAVLEILYGAPVYYDKENDKRVLVSSSVGAYSVPDDFESDNPANIMQMIYPALQQAKMNENGPIIFFDDRIAAMKDNRIMIQKAFVTALREHEFRVFYQPKVDVRTGEIVGAEALCRWFHGSQLVPPMEFIPVLEQSTDICQLDFYMLKAVCTDIRRWLDEGKRAVRISVNFSRKHFVDIDLLKHIMDTINSCNIPHRYIEIELTETTTDIEFRDLKRIVSGLQNEGIYTSVDDFGMGYSSLNLIREIPWNVLKIDKCFLPTDDDPGETTGLMFKHVVSMACDIGLECVTEGVETLKQVEILRKNNCNIAQGFFFDRPLPVEIFEERLDTRYAIE